MSEQHPMKAHKEIEKYLRYLTYRALCLAYGKEAIDQIEREISITDKSGQEGEWCERE